MSISAPFYHFWRHEISKIKDTILRGETLGVVGIYGIGKVILADIIEQKFACSKIKIIRVSLKELPQPNRNSIFKAIVTELMGDDKKIPTFENDFDFHYFLRRIIKNRLETKFVVIFEESQGLLNLPDSFFDSFEALRYYFSPRVAILFFGQPQIYNFPSMGFQHLVKNNYIFLQPFDEKTTEADIRSLNSKFLILNSKFIWRLSQGHHGTIKFILRMLSNRSTRSTRPPRLTLSILKRWISEEPLMDSWIRNEIASLTSNQQEIISKYIANPNASIKFFQNNKAFEDILNFGIFKIRGEKISFLYEPFNFILKKYFASSHKNQNSGLEVKNDKISFDGEKVDDLFNFQESQVIKSWNKAETLSYEDIAKILWGKVWEEKFSLWAINKVVSRLRKKLQLLGANAPKIKTLSKQGYKLQK